MFKNNFTAKSAGIATVIVMVGAMCSSLFAQTTAFAVQGVMSDGGTPANGTYDFQFKLFDAITEGNQISVSVIVPAVQTDNRAWRANVDFGADAFPGADRFLEISYSPAGEGNFITITPRRLVTGIPYSIRARNAANADLANDAQSLGGTAASQFV